MSIKINNITSIDNDRSFITASGTIEERPANPEVGMIRYNTTILAWELYNGAEWENVTEPLPADPDIIALSWGSGNSGQLGDNNVLDRSSPVTVVGGITDWTQIATGRAHSLTLRSNGVLYAWGGGSLGRLGTNDLIDRSSPVTVVGGITDWTQIAAGGAHSLTLRSNGVLYAWGSGNSGRLGTNDLINRSSPVIVVGGITDWTQIAGGAFHSLALRSNGVLYAWGYNGSGLLGTNNTTIARSSPVIVAGGITDWTQISAGRAHNLALRGNGVLYAWGNGYFGRLGTNDLIDRSSPVIVAGGITDWTQISAGNAHSLAIRSNGVLYAWGQGSLGRLGTNNTIARSSPVIVAGGITDWTQISTSSFADHSLALRVAE